MLCNNHLCGCIGYTDILNSCITNAVGAVSVLTTGFNFFDFRAI